MSDRGEIGHRPLATMEGEIANDGDREGYAGCGPCVNAAVMTGFVSRE